MYICRCHFDLFHRTTSIKLLNGAYKATSTTIGKSRDGIRTVKTFSFYSSYLSKFFIYIFPMESPGVRQDPWPRSWSDLILISLLDTHKPDQSSLATLNLSVCGPLSSSMLAMVDSLLNPVHNVISAIPSRLNETPYLPEREWDSHLSKEKWPYSGSLS